MSEKVYQSARAFAQGEPAEAIRNILIDSLDFDESEIEAVFLLSIPHRGDNDGGYQAFLEAAGKVLTSY